MASFSPIGEVDQVHIDLETHLNLIVMQSIAPVSFWLGVLYAFFSISHLFFLQPEIAPLMSTLAVVTALLFFGLSVLVRRNLIPSRYAYPAASTMVGLVLFNSLIHMLLTRDVLQSTNVMLAFVGSAFFILSTRWFIAIILGGLAGWSVVLAQIPASENKVHFVFGMITSVILASIIYYFHIQTTRNLITARTIESRNRLELASLNSIIALITSSLEPDRVFQQIVDAIQNFIPHVNGATLQVLEGRDKLVTRAWSKGLQPEVLNFYVGEGVSGLAASEKNVINVSDVNSESRFVVGMQKVNFRSLLAMPLLVADKVVGVISVEDSSVNAFGPEEERKVKLLAGYAAVAIDNARLYNEHALAEETLKNYTDHLQEVVESRTSELRTAQDKLFAQRGLEQEIDLARQVQTSLLAQEIPQMEGYVFAATAIPARYVGGDFYDFILTGHICNLILADISGKGIPAAMLTSTARTLVRAAMKYESEPALILSNMQDAIYPDLSHAEMFGTFFAASLDPKTAAFTFANAGHTQGIWWKYRSQQVELLLATGLPIGIIPNNEITQKQIVLSPGDMLVFYSDGVTETLNPQNELFGLDRLTGLVRANQEDKAHTLAQRILTEADNFANGAPLADDLTLVVLKVLPRTISFEYQARLDQLDEIVNFIRDQVQMYGDEFAYQIELAVSELVTNIIKYAYAEKTGLIRGHVEIEKEQVIVHFHDQGQAFEIAQLPAVNLDAPHTGGYGLHIIRQIVDELEYIPDKEENHWRISKHFPKGDQ